MLSTLTKVGRTEYTVLVIALATAWIARDLSALSFAAPSDTASLQQRAYHQATADVGRGCRPVLASRPRPAWPKSLKLREGESYKGDPVISFDVNETGQLLNIRVVRSSGVADLDSWVQAQVKRWKYKPSPGCGVRHAEVVITVDFRVADAPQDKDKNGR